MGAGGRTLVVIGASAGGVEALTRLVADLPADLPATVVIVLHVAPSGKSVMPAILSRHGILPAAAAADGAPLAPGRIYIAPPDNHVLVRGRELVLDRGPKHNGHRPAIDPLFESAARAAGEKAVGVILSGTLDDGSAGLAEIKLRGGCTVVQDPEDAMYPNMPAAAIARVEVDHVVPLSAMGALIAELVADPARPPPTPAPAPREPEQAVPPMQGGELSAGPAMPEGGALGLSCPDCGGTLWSVGEGPMHRFRCRIGHVYSEQSMLVEQGRALEGAMWAAVRALEERAALLRRMARRAREGGHVRSAHRFETHAGELDERAAIVRVHIVPPALESDSGAVAEA
jgi:two-component system chemotaxis response regulator CheB